MTKNVDAINRQLTSAPWCIFILYNNNINHCIIRLGGFTVPMINCVYAQEKLLPNQRIYEYIPHMFLLCNYDSIFRWTLLPTGVHLSVNLCLVNHFCIVFCIDIQVFGSSREKRESKRERKQHTKPDYVFNLSSRQNMMKSMRNAFIKCWYVWLFHYYYL